MDDDMGVQVKPSHYDFTHYYSQRRWSSLWQQLQLIIKEFPEQVLEVGPGAGLLKSILGCYGVNVMTVDFDPELKADFTASVTSLPFESGQIDVTCAFQVLEHLPYEGALLGLQELVRVSNKATLISLPIAQQYWRYRVHIPKFGEYSFNLPRPSLGKKSILTPGEHYWEIGFESHTLGNLKRDISKIANIERDFQSLENPYHHFFVLRK